MDWFRNLNAKPRLALGFGILLFLTLIIGLVGTYSLKQAAGRVDALYNRDMRGMQAIENIAIFKNELARSSRDGILQMENPEIVKSDIAAIKNDMQKIREAMKSAEGCFYTKEGIAMFAELSQTVPEYEKVVEGILDGLEKKDAELTKKNTLIVAGPVATKMAEQMERLRVTKEGASAENFEANQKAYQSTLSIIIAIIVAALVIGAIMAIVIANGFSKPLVKTAGVLEKMAEGDLTVALDIDTRDEIGRMASALNQAVGRLNRTMREVAASAAGASSSSQQLAAASEAIASGAQEQAASLEETSASLEEITATVRNTADNAQQASQLAAASKESALQGHEVVSSAVIAMSEIDASSAKISDIISTIDEIAFQTNLLAVNAAVEAARAGEEGRGFAVVATEVRSLAQRSAVAAKEIKTLIQDSLRKVESGSALVNRSGETLQGIVNSVKRVTDIVGEIAASAREQSAGIEQVNTAMTQMDHVTQSNSAQTEELSATAEALSEQSANLLRLVETFKLSTDEDGVGAHLSAPVQRAAAAGPRRIPASKSKFGAKAKVPFARPAVALAAPAESDGNFEEF